MNKLKTRYFIISHSKKKEIWAPVIAVTLRILKNNVIKKKSLFSKPLNISLVK